MEIATAQGKPSFPNPTNPIFMRAVPFCYEPVSTSLALAHELRKRDLQLIWAADGTSLELIEQGEYSDEVLRYHHFDTASMSHLDSAISSTDHYELKAYLASLALMIMTKNSSLEISIIQWLPTRPSYTPGGSQVVVHALARLLVRAKFKVRLLHGILPKDPRTRYTHEGIEYIPAFLINDSVRQEGEPEIELFQTARARLASSEAIFMFDRSFPLTTIHATKILVLGTLAYSFAYQAVRSTSWDVLMVPSVFLREEIQKVLGAGESRPIKVIANPIDRRLLGLSTEFTPTRKHNRIFNLLFPHRADPGKGVISSLQLLRHLAARLPIQLLILKDNSLTSMQCYEDYVMGEASALGIAERVLFIEWQPINQMGHIYSSANLTLCTGSLKEGFGNTSLESVICGTPSLVRQAGAQGRVLPSDHGCFSYTNDIKEAFEIAYAVLTQSSTMESVERGIKYITNHFSLDAFSSSVMSLLYSI